MKIAMVGTGYVGLVTGTCFSEMGNDVICVDVDAKKIAKLESGVLPIYEPGLVDLVQANMERGSLRFTTEIREALETSELVFIAVGTPMGEDGSADLQYVLGVAHEIGSIMEHPLIVVDKSTVPVGTADRVRAAIQEELDKRGSDLSFDVVSNPEFLKEGTACDDFLKPDRVVVGADCAESMQVMQELYRPFILSDDAFIAMDIKSAELTKYAANAMLATKISFINEISNICERVGADVNKVRKGIGSDRRIGYKFIYPGCGYGGSCFPKDVQALIRTSRAFGYDAQILTAVEDVNARQKMVLHERLSAALARTSQEDASLSGGLRSSRGRTTCVSRRLLRLSASLHGAVRRCRHTTRRRNVRRRNVISKETITSSIARASTTHLMVLMRCCSSQSGKSSAAPIFSKWGNGCAAKSSSMGATSTRQPRCSGMDSSMNRSE